MALFGELFASAPKIPRFKPISIEGEQAGAIGQNIANLPGAEKLASSVNTFNQQQLESMLETAIPGYQAIKAKVGKNISSQLSGEIPQDVQDFIQRKAAAKSFSSGFGGSGMAANLTARDLGLTSLQLTQEGLDSATRWISSAAVAPRFDVSSMFITPQQRIGFAQQERDSAFQRKYLANLVESEYSLGSRMARFDETVMNLAMTFFGAGGGAGLINAPGIGASAAA